MPAFSGTRGQYYLYDLQPKEEKWPSFTPADVDGLPLDQLFSQREIKEKRDHMRNVAKKFVDKCYKGRFGKEF